MPNSRYRHRNSNFLSKGSTFFQLWITRWKKKKRKKNYRDLARKNSSTSWIVKLIESVVHEWFFHADGSILFHPCKIWTIKKVECSVHICSVSIYESCRLLLLVNRQKARDRYRRVIHCRYFFSSMHKMTILDSINIKIEEKLSRIWAYSIEILHHKFYNQSIHYFSIDNCSNINPSRRSHDDMLILHFQEQTFIYWNNTYHDFRVNESLFPNP